MIETFQRSLPNGTALSCRATGAPRDTGHAAPL